MRLLFISITLVALSLTACGRGDGGANIRSRDKKNSAPLAGSKSQSSRPCVNLNTATAEELIRLPGIGEATARKIIEYRERNGPFRRAEEIIIIEGFSEQKYRALADLVCVE